MANKKPKSSSKTTKASATKSKATEVAKKTETVEKKSTKKSWCKEFFAKKYEGKESILTVFKTPKFYGSLLGEMLGTMLLTLTLLSIVLMGMASIATYAFVLIAILIAIYAFSGACLNPLITVGMMATRRMSVIRGVMYIIVEIIGAWLGWLIFSGFHAAGTGAYDLPAMEAVAEGGFWLVTMVELMGAVIIGFFFARALAYKRSVFTFGAVVAGGILLAVLVGYVVSAAFLELNNNFVFNPAVAMMLQIFPTSGGAFGEVLGNICQALSIYMLFPMVGGVVGFYLSDLTAKLSGEQ